MLQLSAPFPAHVNKMDRAILEIRARIGSARLLLDRLASCPTERASASRTQCTALVDAVLRAVNIDNAETASLALLAQQVEWDASDAATVARAFAGEQMHAGGRVRQPLQDFQNLHNFFLESEWACIGDSKASMTVRLDVIIGRGISLTLRNPNEWTFKHMTAMLCVLGEDPNHLHTLQAQQKSEMMSHVKQQFRAASRRACTSQEHILKLPPNFSELQRVWPQVASSACAGQEPCQCPFDVRLFHSVGQSFRCRGGVNFAPAPTLSLSGQAGANDVNILDHVQKFAMAMVQGMAKMQEQQSRIFESFGTSAAAPHHSFHSRAGLMPLLTNGPSADVAPTLHIGARADVAPTLHIGSPVVVTTHGYDARPTAPAASTLPRASSLDSLRSDSHAAAHADSTLGSASAVDSHIVVHKADGADASVEKASTAIESTCALLNALDEREREKVVQGKAKAERDKVVQAKGKAKANAKSQSSANDTDHTHDDKERTPVKRCRRKTPAQHVPDKLPKMDTPEKLPNTKRVLKQQKAIAAKRPHFSLEKNRGQFMCRTGVGGPGSTYQISFGAGKQYKSESAALKAAQHWLRDECAGRGFECN